MSTGSRRSTDTFLESLHAGMAGGRGPVSAAGGMQHLTNLLVNISGVKSAEGGSILDAKDTMPPLRSGSLNESPERDESKVVLRQGRVSKQDKRNSAGNRRSLPPGALTLLHSEVWSSESDLPSAVGSPRQKTSNTVQRFSFMFNPFKEKLDRFNEVLSTLSSTGIPSVNADNSSGKQNSDACDNNDNPIELEDEWELVVKNHEMLSKKEHAQQSAIWELLSTEVNYLQLMRSVVNVYARTMAHLQKREEHFLSDVSYDRLFSNIEEVYRANRYLWEKNLSLPLTFSRETGNTLNPLLLKDAFKELPTIFRPYITFCMATDVCHRYLQHQKENNQMFSTFLQWADNQIFNELGIREGLKAHLTKPMQRLTRYKVILNRIKEETTDPVLREELQEMADTVDEYVTEVNNVIAKKQKKDKLHEIQKKIGHYDYVEPPGEEYSQFVSKYSTFKVKTEMRHNNDLRELLLEGYLKMKEGQARWTEVYCFLFTDMFLITKASKRSHPDRLKIIKPPMALDKIRPHMLTGPNASMALVHLTDFDCLSNIYAFTDDNQKLDQWFGKITEARKSYLSALGIEDLKEDPNGSTSAASSQAVRYGRTFSVQSPLAPDKDPRRRSSTFAGSIPGSAPSLSCSLHDDSPSRHSLAPFNPQHISRSPLRRGGHREASPLAREGRESVSTSSPSVVAEVRRSKPGPMFGLGSIDDASCAAATSKKRFSLGAGGAQSSSSSAAVTAVPSVSVARHEAHTASLESFPSSSGVSSVDSAHAHSGSELSGCSLAPSGAGGGGGGGPSSSTTATVASSASTLNGEKPGGHFDKDSVSSLSNGSASDDDEETTCIRVVDKRYSRSLNDLSLQSLAVCESPPPPAPSSPAQRRLAPPLPTTTTPTPPTKDAVPGLSPEKMRIYLIEGSEFEATSV